MIVKVERPGRKSQWLRQRHRELHDKRRPQGFYVAVEGCEECLLEIIWKQNSELVLGVCSFHDKFHPNILKREYRLSTHKIGNQTVFGWFKACSHCIDILFVTWAVLGNKRFS